MGEVLKALKFFGPMTVEEILAKVKMLPKLEDVTEYWVRGNLIKLKEKRCIRITYINGEIVAAFESDLP